MRFHERSAEYPYYYTCSVARRKFHHSFSVLRSPAGVGAEPVVVRADRGALRLAVQLLPEPVPLRRHPRTVRLRSAARGGQRGRGPGRGRRAHRRHRIHSGHRQRSARQAGRPD